MPVSGDTSPFSASTTSNWVARNGGLPPRVRAIARAIQRKNPGWPLSRCIAIAVNAIKYSAATGDSKLPGRQNEGPDVVGAHADAVRQWEQLKAKSKASGKSKRGGSSGKVAASQGARFAPAPGAKVERLTLSGGGGGCAHTGSVPVTSAKSAEKVAADALAALRSMRAAPYTPSSDLRLSTPGSLALGQGPSCKCGGPHDCVFWSQRSTPQILHPGDKADPKTGYGHVVTRRKATKSEEADIKAGRWIRVDHAGNKPGDQGYAKSRLRPHLVKAAQTGDRSDVVLALAKQVAGRRNGVGKAVKAKPTDGPSTGGMIALIPTKADAAKLAVDHPNADPADKMHVTLHYLGDDVTGWDEQRTNDVLQAAKSTADRMGGPVHAQAWAHATFNPTGGPNGDQDPCAVYLIGHASTPGRDKQQTRDEAEMKDANVSPALAQRPDPIQDAHADLKGRMADILGHYAHPQHQPFVPHVTAGYGMQAGDLDHTGPVTFDRLAVHLGGKVHEFPLREQSDKSTKNAPVAASQGKSMSNLALAGHHEKGAPLRFKHGWIPITSDDRAKLPNNFHERVRVTSTAKLKELDAKSHERNGDNLTPQHKVIKNELAARGAGGARATAAGEGERTIGNGGNSKLDQVRDQRGEARDKKLREMSPQELEQVDAAAEKQHANTHVNHTSKRASLAGVRESVAKERARRGTKTAHPTAPNALTLAARSSKTPPFKDPKSGSTTVSKADADDPKVAAMAKKLIAKGYDSERAYKVVTALLRRGKASKGGNGSSSGTVAASQDGRAELLALAADPDGVHNGPGSTPKPGRAEITPDKRRKWAQDGTALEDGSFPVESKRGLLDAIDAAPRAAAGKKAAVRKHIVKHAKRLGMTDHPKVKKFMDGVSVAAAQTMSDSGSGPKVTTNSSAKKPTAVTAATKAAVGADDDEAAIEKAMRALVAKGWTEDKAYAAARKLVAQQRSKTTAAA